MTETQTMAMDVTSIVRLKIFQFANWLRFLTFAMYAVTISEKGLRCAMTETDLMELAARQIVLVRTQVIAVMEGG